MNVVFSMVKNGVAKGILIWMGIALLCFAPFASAKNINSFAYESDKAGVLLIATKNSKQVNGILMDMNRNILTFEAKIQNSSTISGSVIAGNRRIPIRIYSNSKSIPYLDVLIGNAKPYRVFLVSDYTKARFFTPSIMTTITSTLNSASKSKTHKRQNYSQRGNNMSSRDSNYFVGAWKGESVHRSVVTNSYRSSTFFYRFFPNGTFTYSANFNLALKGMNRNIRGNTDLSYYNKSQNGGRWRLVGNKLVLNWKDGETTRSQYVTYTHEGKQMIKLGTNRKNYSFLTRIR